MSPAARREAGQRGAGGGEPEPRALAGASAHGWARRSCSRSPIRCRSRLPVVQASTASTAASSISTGTRAALRGPNRDGDRTLVGDPRPSPSPAGRRRARCRSARAAGRARRPATGAPRTAPWRASTVPASSAAGRSRGSRAAARPGRCGRRAAVASMIRGWLPSYGRPAPSAQAFARGHGAREDDAQVRAAARDRAHEPGEVVEPAALVRPGRVTRADEDGGDVRPERELGHLARVVALRRGGADAPRRARRHGFEQPDGAARRAEHGERLRRRARGLEPRQVVDGLDRRRRGRARAPGRRRRGGGEDLGDGAGRGAGRARPASPGGASATSGRPSSATDVVAAPASIARSARERSSPGHATGSALVGPLARLRRPSRSPRRGPRGARSAARSRPRRRGARRRSGSSPPNRPCSTGSKNSIALEPSGRYGREACRKWTAGVVRPRSWISRATSSTSSSRCSSPRPRVAGANLAHGRIDLLRAAAAASSRGGDRPASASPGERTPHGTPGAGAAERLVTTSQELVARAARDVGRGDPLGALRRRSARTRRRTLTGAPRHVGDVRHHGVHRDVADQRDPPAANQRRGAIRERPRPAVAVAEGQGRDAARPGRREDRAVADAPARRARPRPATGRAWSDRTGRRSAAPAARAGARASVSSSSSGTKPYTARPGRTPVEALPRRPRAGARRSRRRGAAAGHARALAAACDRPPRTGRAARRSRADPPAPGGASTARRVRRPAAPSIDRAAATTSSTAKAAAPEPRLDLDVERRAADRPPSSARPRPGARREQLVVARGHGHPPGPSRHAGERRRDRVEHQDAAGRSRRRAGRSPRRSVATQKPSAPRGPAPAPPASRRGRTRRPSPPGAPAPRSPASARSDGEVARERVEVDLRPGGPRQRREAGLGQPLLDRSAR